MNAFVTTAVFLTVPLFAEPGSKQSVQVEHVTEKPARGDGLATKSYGPSKAERPYFQKLGTDEVATGGLLSDYDIHAKHGKYVGWFGIVRKIDEDKAPQETLITVEHKYFDGLTDSHIQALSFNGDGDFQAVVPGIGHKIEMLSLVKVYGTAHMVKSPADPPRVDAAFVRDWHWGTFTFLGAMGEQHGSEEWRKLNTVDLDDIYDPYPDEDYYERRLGKRPANGDR